ncbi:MAG: carbohydrate ABC transporter permease [Solirubrobacteraceae bacterium]
MATLALVPFVFPLVVLVLGALQPVGRTAPTGWDLIPLPPTTASLEAAFELEPLAGQTLNSLLVVAVAVPLSVLCASWAGFAITQLAPRRRHRAVALAFALLIVPLPGLWVPRFAIFSRLGLVDTFVPLIAPALMGTTPLAVLLFYWSYRRIPRDLVDAARLEGLGPLAIWWSVAEPLVRPTAFAVAALTFVLHWGNFIDPLLYLYSRETYTLPLGLRSLFFVGAGGTSLALAGALVATIPAVVAFAAAQRRFLQATRGAGWLGR